MGISGCEDIWVAVLALAGEDIWMAVLGRAGEDIWEAVSGLEVRISGWERIFGWQL